MSELKNTYNHITVTKEKLFGGRFSANTSIVYHDDDDSLDAGMSWFDQANGIQHILHLNICREELKPQYRHLGYLYKVTVSQLKGAQLSFTVSPVNLSRFLREANFKINPNITQMTWIEPLPPM